jgi:hypothetical protein
MDFLVLAIDFLLHLANRQLGKKAGGGSAPEASVASVAVVDANGNEFFWEVGTIGPPVLSFFA